MNPHIKKSIPVRKLVVTAMLAAVSSVLMLFLSFSVPFVPFFLEWDPSELPALLASFSLGPGYGVLVCLVKNLVNLFFTRTLGIGELSNFILGAVFVFTAGMIYKRYHSFKGAIAGSLIGNGAMALFSLISNYFLIYPLFSIAGVMSKEAILGTYQAIYPGTDSLLEALAIFNIPFTFVKGLFSVIITFLIYKKISPLLKGKK